MFTGDDTFGWIVRVERYFKLNSVLEEMQDTVVIALNRYQWWEEQSSTSSWEEFKGVLICHFQPGLV